MNQQNELPGSIVNIMRQTKPMVTFLGIFGFVTAAIFLLLGMVVTAYSGFGDTRTAVLGWIYLLGAPIHMASSLFLWRYGRAIGVFLADTTLENLSEALSRQKTLWRFAGIVTIVLLVAVALAIVGAAVIAVVGR